MFSPSLCVHISAMNMNNSGLWRMSTIFCLLISISSLHKAFISLGTLLKGSSSLPWLISSQPHRSQAFPTQCSLCSHKDPRNPAACPQLIFPVAILLTQPPTGRGCKCKARNRPLYVQPTPTPSSPSLRPAAEWQKCQSLRGFKPLPTISIKGFSTSPPSVCWSNNMTPPTSNPTVELPLNFFSPSTFPLSVFLSLSLIFPVFSLSGPSLWLGEGTRHVGKYWGEKNLKLTLLSSIFVTTLVG